MVWNCWRFIFKQSFWWIVLNRDKCLGMKWFMNRLKGVFPVESYCQLDRFQNDRYSPKSYVTLFDEIKSLTVEYEQLLQKSSAVTNFTVNRTYFGKEHVLRTMMLLILIAILLHWKKLDLLGSIMISEYPALIQTHKNADKHHSSIESDPSSECSFRVYCEFLKLHYLYNWTPFMNGNSDAEVQAQIHTLYRVRELCKSNGFRNVQKDEVTEK